MKISTRSRYGLENLFRGLSMPETEGWVFLGIIGLVGFIWDKT